MIGKRILLICAAAVFATGCAGEPDAKERKSWLQEHGDEIMKYAYTKAEIEAEVDAMWREGFSLSGAPDEEGKYDGET